MKNRNWFSGAVIPLTVLVLEGGALLLWLYLSEWNELTLRQALRGTARISLLLFLPVFIAGPWRRRQANSLNGWLLKERRYLGLSFAVSHGIHLCTILLITASIYDWDLLKANTLVTYIGGGLTYLFILLLALTSNNAAYRSLGSRNWKILHSIGIYLIFLIFLVSYGPKAILKAPWKSGPEIVLLAALALRLADAWRRRKRADA
ncbi:MAG: hypothetical protein K1X75_15915 [Leptospirales bacterium]|nr:hypothetical protein [Leptospirales bacterium]